MNDWILDLIFSLAAGTVVGLIYSFAVHGPNNRDSCPEHFLKCWTTYACITAYTIIFILINVVIKMANGDVFQ